MPVYIPAADHPPGSVRPVWPDLEDNPRYVGDARGDTYLPAEGVPPGTPDGACWSRPQPHLRVRRG